MYNFSCFSVEVKTFTFQSRRKIINLGGPALNIKRIFSHQTKSWGCQCPPPLTPSGPLVLYSCHESHYLKVLPLLTPRSFMSKAGHPPFLSYHLSFFLAIPQCRRSKRVKKAKHKDIHEIEWWINLNCWNWTVWIWFKLRIVVNQKPIWVNSTSVILVLAYKCLASHIFNAFRLVIMITK